MQFEKIVYLFEQTQLQLQKQVARAADTALVVRNWLFGFYIIEYEQNGADRAVYGEHFLEALSKKLHGKIKGSSLTRLKLYRSFYIKYRH